MRKIAQRANQLVVIVHVLDAVAVGEAALEFIGERIIISVGQAKYIGPCLAQALAKAREIRRKVRRQKDDVHSCPPATIAPSILSHNAVCARVLRSFETSSSNTR